MEEGRFLCSDKVRAAFPEYFYVSAGRDRETPQINQRALSRCRAATATPSSTARSSRDERLKQVPAIYVGEMISRRRYKNTPGIISLHKSPENNGTLCFTFNYNSQDSELIQPSELHLHATAIQSSFPIIIITR